MRFLPVIIVLIGLGCSQRPEELLSRKELNALPHVSKIEVFPIGEPETQIIQIRNLRFVDYKANESDGLKEWNTFLQSVEDVQKQQVELLCRLRDDHGVKTVFLEGLAEADLDGWRKVATNLASWKEPAENDPNGQFLRQQHRKQRLAMGAVAQVKGLQVLPAVDSEILNMFHTGPLVNRGKESYEDAILLTSLTSEENVVVVMTMGDHDLSDNLKRIIADGAELVFLQVEAHHKAEIESPGY